MISFLFIMILFFVVLIVLVTSEKVLDVVYARKRGLRGESSFLFSLKANGVWVCAIVAVTCLLSTHLKIVDGGLIVRNNMNVDYLCDDSGDMIVIKPNTGEELKKNGRCYVNENDGKQTLVEWNIVGANVYLDVSYVDACSYNSKITVNNRTVAESNCGCSHDHIIYSPCTTYRSDSYCCLGSYGDAKSCDVNTDYYRMLQACSNGVYKYAYDDEVGLKTLSITDDVFVDVFYGSLEERDDAQGPVTSDVKDENRTIFRKFVNIVICCYMCLGCCSYISFYLEEVFVGIF